MTPQEADAAQDWSGMDGYAAFWAIERSADNWPEAGALMDAWLRAKMKDSVVAERERCALIAIAARDGYAECSNLMACAADYIACAIRSLKDDK